MLEIADESTSKQHLAKEVLDMNISIASAVIIETNKGLWQNI